MDYINPLLLICLCIIPTGHGNDVNHDTCNKDNSDNCYEVSRLFILHITRLFICNILDSENKEKRKVTALNYRAL